jgi:hypothetical protein
MDTRLRALFSCVRKFLIVIGLVGCFFMPDAAYAQVPTITSFSPTLGRAGATVTITGTNFSAAATVFQ